MIGQTNLQSRIEQLIENNTFPRFSIFVGPKGSGKKTFVPYISGYMKAGWVHAFDVKVDTIREIIQQSYKIVDPTVYFIPDADNMSLAAKNALLKVTEEPPNNAYFILTLEDENNTLETIRSRGTVFHMDRYTPDEIEKYAVEYLEATPNGKWDIVRDLCETPGDVDILEKMGVKEFNDYVNLFVDNIFDVSLANALKTSDKIALKDGADGYDMKLFMKAVANVFFARNLLTSFLITTRYIQQLRIKGVNKQMMFDNWVIEIRGE